MPISNKLLHEIEESLEAMFNDNAYLSIEVTLGKGLDITLGNAGELGHLVGETYTLEISNTTLQLLSKGLYSVRSFTPYVKEMLFLGLAEKMWSSTYDKI